MPYIGNGEHKREYIQQYPREAGTSGELNFAITSILTSYIHNKGPSYNTYNEVIGALECVKQELYRRVIGKYEDQKIGQNGDVFPDWMLGKTGRDAMIVDQELTPSRNAPPSPPVILPQAEIVRLEEAKKRHPNQPQEFTDAEMFDLRSSLQERERRAME